MELNWIDKYYCNSIVNSVTMNSHWSNFVIVYFRQQFWQPGLQPSTSQEYVFLRLILFNLAIVCPNFNCYVSLRFFVYSIKPFSQQPYGGKPATAISGEIDAGHPSAQASWEGRAIATSKFRLLEFSAFMEVQREEVVSEQSGTLSKCHWKSFLRKVILLPCAMH